MYQDVIDQLMVTWYGMYQANKEKIDEDDEFSKSRERKKMDEFIGAIVLLWQNKSNRGY